MNRTDDFDTFFTMHYGPMVRSLTLVGGNAELAADAVQDAFVRAHSRWRRVSRYDVPAAWVRRVAINRMRDLHRSESRRAHREERAGPAEATVATPEPADDDLMAKVRELPERQRVAIALHYLEDLSVAEVATTMGITDGAVKYHLHKGRGHLEAAMRSDDVEGRRG